MRVANIEKKIKIKRLNKRKKVEGRRKRSKQEHSSRFIHHLWNGNDLEMSCNKVNFQMEMTCSKGSAVCFPPTGCSRPLAVALPSGGENCCREERCFHSMCSPRKVIQVKLKQEPPGIETKNATACKGHCLIDLSGCSTVLRRPTVLIWEQMPYIMVLLLMGRQKKTSHAEEDVLNTSKNNI